MLPFEWVTQAAERISSYIVRTPVIFDNDLNIYLKLENRQVTSSFKIRGALNKILTLEKWEREQGLVTASAGNHGQGVAFSGRIVGSPVVVFASDHAVPSKVDAMRKFGADVRFVKGGYGLAEQTALDYSEQNHLTYISPYNDGQIIAGQGTIGLEVLQDINDITGLTWVVPVGGGGLISGIGSVIQSQKIKTELVGVQPEASAFTYSLFYKGHQSNVSDLPTLADGLSGPIQIGSITLPIMRSVVNQIIMVDENEIEKGIAYSWYKHHEVIEGSAAAALAAVISGKIKTPCIVIISGGNIQSDIHSQICQKYAGRL
jgi:threonine dehydratase